MYKRALQSPKEIVQTEPLWHFGIIQTDRSKLRSRYFYAIINKQ